MFLVDGYGLQEGLLPCVPHRGNKVPKSLLRDSFPLTAPKLRRGVFGFQKKLLGILNRLIIPSEHNDQFRASHVLHLQFLVVSPNGRALSLLIRHAEGSPVWEHSLMRSSELFDSGQKTVYLLLGVVGRQANPDQSALGAQL